MATVSVIIPCYNQGAFIDEALDSVLAQTFDDLEIVVVNDGSTDPLTIAKLQGLGRPRTRVLHTPNRGLPAARNAGIAAASGRYILPLDADDRIAPAYVEKAVAVLEAEPDVGVVYCRAELFGDRRGEWGLPEYQFPDILFSPRIFAAALFRRVDWESAGGYSDLFRGGWEDYDFWLSLIGQGRRVVRLPEVLFYYRQLAGSMARGMDDAYRAKAFRLLFERHRKLYEPNMGEVLSRAFAHTLTWEAVENLRLQMESIRADREREIQAIKGTLSWRLTRPVRWLGLLAAKVRRGAARAAPGAGGVLWRSHVDAPGFVAVVPAGDVTVSGWCVVPPGAAAQAVRLRTWARSALCESVPRADVAERLGVSESSGSCGFAGTVAVRPGLCLLRITAVRPGGARLIGLRLLVVLPRGSIRSSYERWLRRSAVSSAAEGVRAARLAAHGARISVVMPGYNAPVPLLREAIESVRGQSYERWELCIADDASSDPRVRPVLEEYAAKDSRIKVAFRAENGHIARASQSALELATGAFVALLDHDDVLYPGALRAVAEAAAARPEAELFYSDEDKITVAGRRHDPAFKSDFDPELLRTYDYLGHLVAIRRERAMAAGGFRPESAGSQDWDLILRVVESLRADQVVHIPEVLYGWRVHAGSTARSLDAKAWVEGVWERVLRDHVARSRVEATVSPGLYRGSMRVRYAVPGEARLSLLVVAETMAQAAEAAGAVRRSCRTPFVDAHVIGLRPTEPDEVSAEGLVVRRGAPSWARLGDQAASAVRRAAGDAIVCVQPGASLDGPESVDELLGQAMRPGIGLVAPLEHHRGGGDVAPVFALMRNGIARRLFRAAGSWDAGYLGRLRSVQSAALLNAPVFCVRRDQLQKLLAADRVLAPSVPLSLQLSYAAFFAGLRSVYTPHARARVWGPARTDDAVYLGGARAAGGDSEAFCDPVYNPALGGGDVTWRPVSQPRGLRQFKSCLRDPFARSRLEAGAAPAGGAGCGSSDVVDVLVPVYGGREETMQCLESALAARSQVRSEIVVVNDASPEPAITDYLRSLAADGRITLVENAANAGFVASVNRGLRLHPERDVVLLNSDTLVRGDWVDRLRAAALSSPDIGTATPLSNNATIFSYPLPGRENPMPSRLELEDADEACRAANDGRAVDVPTGVGFCMYIRRAALTEAGLLDETLFGRGYGEENDLCCRMAARGWRSVAATGTYVAHRGCVSFGAGRARQVQAAEAALRAVQQDYFESVARFCRLDPLAGDRRRIAEARLRKPGQPRVLAVLHAWGGGVGKHVRDLSVLLQGHCAMLRLAPTRAGGRYELDLLPGGQPLSGAGRRELSLDEACDALRRAGITRVHFHHFLGLPSRIIGLPRELGVPYDVTVHDFYSVCPRINLYEPAAGCCGGGDEARCRRCLRQRPVVTRRGIRRWRRDYLRILTGAERVFVPSEFVAGVLRKIYPAVEAKIAVVPHPDLGEGELLRGLPGDPPAAGEPLRVLILGAVSQLKGAAPVRAAAALAMQRQLLVDFHWLGEIHMSLPTWPDTRLWIHGAYTHDDLPGRLRALRPHAVWMASPVPETYSYTLTEVLGSGLPIVATRMGALEERLVGAGNAILIDPSDSPGDVLDVFVRLRDDLICGRIQPAVRPPAPCGNEFYRGSYVRPAGSVGP